MNAGLTWNHKIKDFSENKHFKQSMDHTIQILERSRKPPLKVLVDVSFNFKIPARDHQIKSKTSEQLFTVYFQRTFRSNVYSGNKSSFKKSYQ